MTGLFSHLLTQCLEIDEYKKSYSGFLKFILVFIFSIIVLLVIVFVFQIKNGNSFIYTIVSSCLLVSLCVIENGFSRKERKKSDFIEIQKKRISCVKKVTDELVVSLIAEDSSGQYQNSNLSEKKIVTYLIFEGEACVNRRKYGRIFTNVQAIIIIPILLLLAEKLLSIFAEYIFIIIAFILIFVIVEFTILFINLILHIFIGKPGIDEDERFLSYLKLIYKE
jgi:hypothetical protein